MIASRNDCQACSSEVAGLACPWEEAAAATLDVVAVAANISNAGTVVATIVSTLAPVTISLRIFMGLPFSRQKIS
jgi:hypothetical protein